MPTSLRYHLSLIASICSFILLLLALYLPFISSDIQLHTIKKLQAFDQKTSAPCTSVKEKLGTFFDKGSTVTDLIDKGCKATVDPLTKSTRNAALDKLLGPVDGKQSWKACLEEGPEQVIHQNSMQTLSPFNRCLKVWTKEVLGVPIGPRYLPEMIRELFLRHEILLGCALVIFSLLFPLLKITLNFWILFQFRQQKYNPRLFNVLQQSGKWSMTDVFVVALMIITFKAESFNFQFTAETGVICFGMSVLTSMLSTMWISPLLSQLTKNRIEA